MKGRFVDIIVPSWGTLGILHTGAVHHGTMGRRPAFPKWKEVAGKEEPRKVCAQAACGRSRSV